MEEKLFSIASKVTKPISLASIIVIVLYIIYKAILGLEVFNTLSEDSSFNLLDGIVNKIFILALVALLLGTLSFLFTQTLKNRTSAISPSITITGNVYFFSGHPVEKATVIVEGIDRRKLTDSSGWFQVEVSPNKSWTIRAIYNDRVISKSFSPKDFDKPINLTFPKEELLPIESECHQPIHNLPQPDYGYFVGREHERQNLIKLLLPHPHSPHYVITILGVGGVGKTALALDIANYYFYNNNNLPADERFQAIVWFSAKETVLSGNKILPRWPSQKTIDDLYTTIAEVFNISEINENLSPEEKDRKIRQILKNQRTLLILDNLETVDDKRLLDFILHPPVPTKIIVTTRHWVSVAFPINLEGMPHTDALKMVDQQCKIGNVELQDDAKEKLVTRTGGIPLAIVWSIGLIRSSMSIDAVLELLGNAKSSVAKFIFKASVDQIDKTPAVSLLATLALFLEYATDYEVRQYAYREELGNLSELSNADRDEGLATLYQLSLVSHNSNQFSLLPLTRSFVLEDIVENSKSQYEDLRKRVNNAVFGLSQHTPFIYGTPVPAERFVGRQREIRVIVNRIRNRESTFITGEPRSGKSSLLHYIASSDEITHILGDSFWGVIKVEINAADIPSPAKFWEYILIVVDQSVKDVELSIAISNAIEHPEQSFFEIERIFSELEKQGKNVLVLLDEIEHFFNNRQFNNAEFWGTLRSLASRLMSFQILIASTYSVSEVNTLTRTINQYGSPFFNIFIQQSLEPFNQDIVDTLINNALKESQVKFNNNDKKLISWLSGNHPYRIQVAGSSLFDLSNDKSVPEEEKYSMAIEQFYERTINHFDDLWIRYFHDEFKITLLYIGLLEISETLNLDIPQSITTGESLQTNLRYSERLGWIQQAGNDTWHIAVGGFLFWLIDKINFSDEKIEIKSWLLNSNLASRFLSIDNWQYLLSLVSKFRDENPVIKLAKYTSKSFISD